MSAALYQHLFPGRVRVLGRWIPPLSLHHLAALDAIRSPFITGLGNIDLPEVQIAVKVCLTRWPDTPDVFAPTLRDHWQNWWHGQDERYVRDQAELLMAHVQLHLTPPEMHEFEGEKPKYFTAPHVLSRFVGLLELGISYETAWNDITPGFASWLLATHAERQGSEQRFAREDDDVEAEGPPLPQNEAELREFMAGQGFKPEQIEEFLPKFLENQAREAAAARQAQGGAR